MASLTVATAARAGAGSIVVANRTPERAPPPGRAVRRDGDPARRARRGHRARRRARLLHGRDRRPDRRRRGLRRAGPTTRRSPSSTWPCLATSTRPSADLPGVRLIALETLAAELEDAPGGADVAGVRTIVAQELAAFLTARRSQSVTPTVVALRTMATGVVEAELARLDRAAARAGRRLACRGGEADPPRRREAAPPADRPRQGAGQRAPAPSPTPPRWPSCSRSTPRPSRP